MQATAVNRMVYMYRDLAKIPRGEPIPEEVNAGVVRALDVFKSAEFKALMGEARKLRLFGCLKIADQTGLIWATVEFHNGIATMFYRHTHAVEGRGVVRPTRPYRFTLEQSDKNRSVVMRPRKQPQTEGKGNETSA